MKVGDFYSEVTKIRNKGYKKTSAELQKYLKKYSKGIEGKYYRKSTQENDQHLMVKVLGYNAERKIKVLLFKSWVLEKTFSLEETIWDEYGTDSLSKEFSEEITKSEFEETVETAVKNVLAEASVI